MKHNLVWPYVNVALNRGPNTSTKGKEFIYLYHLQKDDLPLTAGIWCVHLLFVLFNTGLSVPTSVNGIILVRCMSTRSDMVLDY